MSARPIKLRDRILYTQALTQAGYVVHALVSLDVLRGGVMARGRFERNGVAFYVLDISTAGERFVVGGQAFDVTVMAGGLFTLTEVSAQDGGAP